MKRLILLVLAAVVTLTAAACGPEFPTDDPAIEGIVTSVTKGDTTLTMLVEVPEDELPSPASSYAGLDKASVTITADTLLFDDDAQTLPMSRFERPGVRVRVWITGPIAESYPVQATASAVKLLTE